MGLLEGTPLSLSQGLLGQVQCKAMRTARVRSKMDNIVLKGQVVTHYRFSARQMVCLSNSF